jgi:hypothetical protein
MPTCFEKQRDSRVSSLLQTDSLRQQGYVDAQQPQPPSAYVLTSTQVGGMKQILHRRFGHGKLPRRPLLPMSEEEADAVLAHEYLLKVLEEELLIV